MADAYPWYTPYQFAGNRPVTFIDLDGLEELDPLLAHKMLYSGDKVLMDNAPPKVRTLDGKRWFYTTTNAAGEKRNQVYYWNKLYERNPHHFSKANVKLIKEGKAPIADPQWINYHKEHSDFRFQKLEHHHKNHGSKAYALPWKAHRGKGNYKIWHYTGKAAKQLRKGSKSNALGILPFLDPTEWSGWMAGRPDSFLHGLEGILSPNVGELYANAVEENPGNYFVIREMNAIKNDQGDVIGYHSVVDYYEGTLEDGRTPDEETFVHQQEFRETLDGRNMNDEG